MNQETISSFLDKCKILAEKYQELTQQRLKYSENNQVNQLTKINKTIVSLESLFFVYKDYQSIAADLAELKDALEVETNSELKTELENEITKLTQANEENIEKFLNLLADRNKDIQSNADVIIEIKGTSGGDEAKIFAIELFKMYQNFALKNKWKTEIITFNDNIEKGSSSIIFKVKGKNAYKKLYYESGIHRVQRIPKTEARGRVHTSAAAVMIFEAPSDKVKINIAQKDIRIDTYRASGAGGQHVNKTDSAVRITHLPTGVVVSSQECRSQHENKHQAMQVLETKLLEKKLQEQRDNISSRKKYAFGTGDRSEKIRTYNFPQDRVTDHRISQSWNNLPKIMSGAIEGIVDSLAEYEKHILLKEATF